MLVVAYDLLEPGGVLVYSTCTLAPEENELPLHQLLGRRPAARVEAIDLDLEAGGVDARPGLRSWDGERFDDAVGRALRILPGRGMETFFVARIAKPDL